jgi:translation initiation factor 1
MAKKKDENPPKSDAGKAASPFAALAGLRDALPPGPQAAPSEPRETSRPATGPARAVVRLERKGRGGKEATCIEKLGLPADELERWCSELKKALGCGGSVERDAIVLHGDLRQRLEPLLRARGVRKVTLAQS